MKYKAVCWGGEYNEGKELIVEADNTREAVDKAEALLGHYKFDLEEIKYEN